MNRETELRVGGAALVLGVVGLGVGLSLGLFPEKVIGIIGDDELTGVWEVDENGFRVPAGRIEISKALQV